MTVPSGQDAIQGYPLNSGGPYSIQESKMDSNLVNAVCQEVLKALKGHSFNDSGVLGGLANVRVVKVGFVLH